MKVRIKAVIYTLLLGTLFSFSISTMQAQCKIANDYFQSGEELDFDLYFKYGIIYTKAGHSSLKVASTKHDGKDAYKMSLFAKSTGVVKKMFMIDDTLSSYVTKDLAPLAFRKNALEGKDYTIENVDYTYRSGGGVDVKTKRIRNGTLRFDEILSADDCIYDMVSVVYYARTLDYSSMKKGDFKSVEFVAGRRKVYMVIEHGGIETVKGNDDKKYECIKLTLSLSNVNKLAFDDKDKEEAMKVYVTNDKNRLPVRLDTKLKVGSTRGIIRSYKGLKHAVGSQ